MDETRMSVREARRLGALKAAVCGDITNRDGAERSGLSVRQFKRLRRRIEQRGDGALAHGNRGRRSSRRLEETTRRRVVELLQGATRPNDCHLSDLLAEEKMTVSPATVRRIRQVLELPAKQRRRPARHHRRRDREACEGAMVLIDGSPFCWLGPEHGMQTLVGTIDDAAGKLLALTFRPTEDLHGYALVLERMVTTCGVPGTVYGDGTGIAVRNDSGWTIEEELEGRQRPTHFGQMLEELGIRYIRARSPQAKGRIERLWRTLQDRLTTELALQGVTTWEAAEAFLSEYMARFNRQLAVPARKSVPAWQRPPRQFERVVACRYTRVVGRDNVVRFFGAEIHILPGPHRRSYHGRTVEVRECLDGQLLVLYQDLILARQPAPAPPFILMSRDSERGRRSKPRLSETPRSTPIDDRSASRPKPHAPRDRLGQITNIRRPKPDHPYKRGCKPQPPTRVAGVGG
jgi:transposase